MSDEKREADVIPFVSKKPSASVQEKLDASLALIPRVAESGWTVAHILPGEYKDRIERALPVVQASLEPAAVQDLAVAFGKLVEWIEAYGIVPLPEDPVLRRSKIAKITRRYADDLGGLPGDLLVRAVRDVTRRWTFRTLPLPGDFQRVVADELGRRKLVLARMELALSIGKFEQPTESVPCEEHTPAAQAHVADLVARFRAEANEHEAAREAAGVNADGNIPRSAD